MSDLIELIKLANEYAQSNIDTFGAFMHESKSKGFVELGRGSYSTAYSFRDNPDFVLKIARRADPCYHWLRIAEKHKENPYMPRVHFMMPRTRMTGYACIMERLSEIKYRTMMYDQLDAFQIFALNRHQVREEFETDPHAVQTRTLIRELIASAPDHCEDLHDGNIMARGEQLVITDPVC